MRGTTLSAIALLCLLLPLGYCVCPVGSIVGFSPNECFMYRMRPLSWYAAEQDCRGKGGHLASVANAFVNSFLVALVDSDITVDFWVGGSKGIRSIGNWSWSDGTPFVYTDWASGQPDETNAHNCINIPSRDGSWSANPCSLSKTYVCRIITGRPATQTSTAAPTTAPNAACPFGFTFSEASGKCYLLNHCYGSWSDCDRCCRLTGASLASLHGRNERKWIRDTYSSLGTSYWIGVYSLSGNGSWLWPDGTIYGDRMEWAPDRYSDANDANGGCRMTDDCCAYALPRTSDFYPVAGQWLVQHCANSNSGICEKPAIPVD